MTHPALAPIQSPSARPYDLAAYLGRFQPFTRGHAGAVMRALEKADRLLIGVGSANLARDTRNPFFFHERKAVIEAALHDALAELLPGLMPESFAEAYAEFSARITICPIADSPYDVPAWINRVQTAVREATPTLRPRVALVGNIRDATSEYLTWFPAWDYVACPDTGINATAIRKGYFAGGVDFSRTGWSDTGDPWIADLYPSTIEFLHRFRDKNDYAYLMSQKAAEEAYHAKWGPGPFQTVDPVIIKGDHVLMIERGGAEGAGMVGLPGGFLNPGERLLDGAVREGIEETHLFRQRGTMGVQRDAKEAQDLLKSYQRGHGVRFDDPHRSRRGHLITEAFLFVLPNSHGLPPVVGQDDAKRAFWMPISEVQPSTTFEDHAFIIDKMLNQL